MNQAKLIGNLGADPLIKPAANGKEAAFFSIANNERWKDKATGELREDVQWHQIAVFEPSLVELTKTQLRKGSFVHIEGRIANRKWQDGEGNERLSSQIIVSGPQAMLTLVDRRPANSASRGR